MGPSRRVVVVAVLAVVAVSALVLGRLAGEDTANGDSSALRRLVAQLDEAPADGSLHVRVRSLDLASEPAHVLVETVDDGVPGSFRYLLDLSPDVEVATPDFDDSGLRTFASAFIAAGRDAVWTVTIVDGEVVALETAGR